MCRTAPRPGSTWSRSRRPTTQRLRQAAVPRHDQGLDREPGPVHFLNDGTFLWLSERDGWKHIYHTRRRHAQGPAHVGPVGGPPARARRPKDGWIYFTRTSDKPDGEPTSIASSRAARSSGSRRPPGTPPANMSPDGKLFLSSRSDITHARPDRLIRRGRQAASARSTRTRRTS